MRIYLVGNDGKTIKFNNDHSVKLIEKSGFISTLLEDNDSVEDPILINIPFPSDDIEILKMYIIKDVVFLVTPKILIILSYMDIDIKNILKNIAISINELFPPERIAQILGLSEKNGRSFLGNKINSFLFQLVKDNINDNKIIFKETVSELGVQLKIPLYCWINNQKSRLLIKKLPEDILFTFLDMLNQNICLYILSIWGTYDNYDKIFEYVLKRLDINLNLGIINNLLKICLTIPEIDILPDAINMDGISDSTLAIVADNIDIHYNNVFENAPYIPRNFKFQYNIGFICDACSSKKTRVDIFNFMYNIHNKHELHLFSCSVRFKIKKNDDNLKFKTIDDFNTSINNLYQSSSTKLAILYLSWFQKWLSKHSDPILDKIFEIYFDKTFITEIIEFRNTEEYKNLMDNLKKWYEQNGLNITIIDINETKLLLYTYKLAVKLGEIE